MTTLTRCALTVLLALLVVSPAAAQWDSITVNHIGQAGSSGITFDHEIKQAVGHSDGQVFVPAIKSCRDDGAATLTPTRVAANDWALARTLGTSREVHNITCELNSWLARVGGAKGLKITGVSLVHQILTQNLAFATWGKVATRRFVNNTATDIGPDLATAPTLPTATQTNPYVTAITVTTPRYLPANTNTDLNLEYAIEANATTGGVYRLYGVVVSFTRLDH